MLLAALWAENIRQDTNFPTCGICTKKVPIERLLKQEADKLLAEI